MTESISQVPSFRATPSRARPLDLPALLSLLRRRWPLLAVPTLVVPALVWVGTLLVAPSFSSTAQLTINPTQRAVPTGEPSAAFSGLPDQGLVDTEVSILRSNDVAGAVVDRLRLGATHEFGDPRRKLWAPPPPRPTAAQRRGIAIGNVLAHLDTKREGVSYVVDVTAHSLDPRLAAAIANGFADAYTQNSIDTRVQSAERQSKWVDDRLQTLADAAQAADAAVARYRAEHDLATTGGPNGATITDQQVAPLSGQLAGAQSEAAGARAKYLSAAGQASAGRTGSVSSVLTSALITELQAQRTQVLRTVAEVDARYGPLHPETAKVHRQLEDVDRAIAAESQRIVASLRTDSQAAEARASNLRGQLGALRGVQAGDERAAVDADALQRRADSARLIYTQLAQAAQQLGQERQSHEPLARLFNRAEAAGAPSFPNRKLLTALGLVVGLIVGLALLVAREALDDTVSTLDDVGGGLGAALAGCLPRRGSGRRGSSEEEYAEAVRALRSGVLLAARHAGGPGLGRVVATTSAGSPGDAGATAALARSLALSGRRVLLLDVQPQAGGVAVARQRVAPQGDATTGVDALDRSLVLDTASGLLSARPDGAGREVLTGPEISRILAGLRRRFDWVVVDTAPVLGSADARALCAEADVVLLLIDWGRTRRAAAAAALGRLQEDGASLAGVVLTDVNTAAAQALGRGSEAFRLRSAAA